MAGDGHFAHIAARWISNLANPLVLAAAVFSLVVFREPGSSGHNPVLVLGVCLFFGVLLPLAYVVFLLYRGQIEGVFIAHQTARKRPLWLLAGSCCAGAGVLWGVAAPLAVQAVMAWYTGLAVLAGLMVLRWKISLHAVGAWGTLGALVFLLGPPAFAFAPLALAVSWSRVALEAHTPGQVVGGAGLALISAWVLFGFVLGA